jgi:(+)-trans-carveol dehydrogenase
MARFDGSVALITGAARGQGRSHAIRLAQEGADIIALDVMEDYATVGYGMATDADMKQTVALVEETGQRILSFKADVRERSEVTSIVDEALEKFGHIDIVCANAGIGPSGFKFWDLPETQWDDTLETNLKGVWTTCAAVVPAMIARAQGGSIIVTSSGAALKAPPNMADYNSAKLGIIGLMKSMANELAEHYIRVNAVCPTACATDMLLNDSCYRLFRPDLDNPTKEDCIEGFRSLHPIPEPWVEPADVSNAVAWLASSEARYVTGSVIPIDLGLLNKY